MHSKYFIYCLLGTWLAGTDCLRAEGLPVTEKQEKDSVQWQMNSQELVVLSFKQEQDLSLSPVSATTFQAGTIKNKNITDLKGISALAPNFFMPDYGSRLTAPVYVRGIGSKINAPSVGLYVDDMPYFEKSAFSFDFQDIERVEVLRGPQGTLYGRNTMGGLIKIYTRSPFRYQGTTLSASAGSYLNTRLSVSHYGRIGSDWGYSAGIQYNRSQGSFTNHATGKRADRMNAGSVNARLEWRPHDHLQVRLVTLWDKTDQGGYPYAPYDPETGKTGEVNYNDPGSYKRLMGTTGLSVHYQAPRFQLNSQTSYQYVDDKQGIDQDFSVNPIYYARQLQTQHMVSQELNFKSAPSDSWYHWLIGAFGFWQGIDNQVSLDYKSKETQSNKYYDQPTYGVAFYHQSEFRNIIGTGLSLTAGLRYDLEWASMDYRGALQQVPSSEVIQTFDPFKSRLHYGQLTPKVALQYKFPSSGQVYASVSKGYKTGGFNTSFETDDQRSFEPEHSWNYEIGAKHPFFDQRLSAEVAFFWIDWRHQQISQPLPSGQGSMQTNAGRSQSKGVEVSLTGRLFNGLVAHVNYGYTHATFRDYRSGKKDYTGHYLPFVPQHTFTAGLNYGVSSPCRGIDRLNVNADFVGNGRIYWREDNIVSQPFYGMLHARISVSKGPWTCSLWGQNLTATRYTAFYFESGPQKLAQRGKPCTVGADVQFTF